MLKRIFDLTGSFLGLIILSPLFIFFGLLIKLLMPGPIFFSQVRIGRNGKEFIILKFRTMTVKKMSSAGSFDPGDRSRITSLGKILRRYKIDEIPQLINVLKGDMSLVGPRPEVRKWTEVYPEKWAIAHSVRPGMTGLDSIVFRNEEDYLSKSSNPDESYSDFILPRKLDLYIYYTKNRTFFGDIMIIFRTIRSVLFK